METYNPTCHHAAENKEIIENYIEDFPENLKKGRCIKMLGNVGTGKTHLCYALAEKIIQTHSHILRNGIRVVTISDIFKQIKQTFEQNSQNRNYKYTNTIIQDCKTPDLLIIDEVGVQLGTNFELTTIFDILDHRYQYNLPTIVNSNFNVQALGGYIGERIVDRMNENGGLELIFDWESYRK